MEVSVGNKSAVISEDITAIPTYLERKESKVAGWLISNRPLAG
jgi:hypothetical protein